MITSALIAQLRREYRDVPKSYRALKLGDGVSTLFNVGEFPVIENSYSVSLGTSARTEGSQFTLDLDNGDLQFLTTPALNIEAKAEYKYAHWRDKNWVEAINQGIEELNGRGFFRQTVRQTFNISAGVRTVSGPSACIDIYELLYVPASGSVSQLPINWSYQQDANKIVLGSTFSTRTSAARSYLRNMQTYSATSATLDVLNDWLEAVKKYAGHRFYRSLAGKVATQGNASIDEGHFSFTNLRTMSNDLLSEFDMFAKRKKPTRPAKGMQYHIEGGGIA